VFVSGNKFRLARKVVLTVGLVGHVASFGVTWAGVISPLCVFT
jgi:hypothetical protein